MCNAKIKPFECVGTKKESRLALYLSLQKNPKLDFDAKPRRKDLEECFRAIDSDALEKECLESFQEPHNVPDDLLVSLRNSVENLFAS